MKKRRVNICLLDSESDNRDDIEVMLAAEGIKAVAYRPESYKVEDCDWGMQQRIPQHGLAGSCDVSVVNEFADEEKLSSLIASSQVVATDNPLVAQLCEKQGVKRLKGKELAAYCRTLLS